MTRQQTQRATPAKKPAASSAFRIESHVPMPTTRTPAPAYPLADMEVGDSFLVAHADDETLPKRRLAVAQQLRGITSRDDNLASCTFMARAVPGGIRVWRTK